MEHGNLKILVEQNKNLITFGVENGEEETDEGFEEPFLSHLDCLQIVDIQKKLTKKELSIISKYSIKISPTKLKILNFPYHQDTFRHLVTIIFDNNPQIKYVEVSSKRQESPKHNLSVLIDKLVCLSELEKLLITNINLDFCKLQFLKVGSKLSSNLKTVKISKSKSLFYLLRGLSRQPICSISELVIGQNSTQGISMPLILRTLYKSKCFQSLARLKFSASSNQLENAAVVHCLSEFLSSAERRVDLVYHGLSAEPTPEILFACKLLFEFSRKLEPYSELRCSESIFTYGSVLKQKMYRISNLSKGDFIVSEASFYLR
eukprot:snap_masked-scaffold_5-processed-gene-8.58-mRNA-1 protein AED:0.20 eAED:1.00 QI:0/-1/0/1/-1/1/1/0/318